ncbi:MAG TPA: putative quinol monooxygenase [Terracidiphilus sp.]|nr:putative quinol monooxygenase [Terracidiphilus sp.]
MIAKITVAAGKRDEMIALLQESADGMPGCLSYIVARDAANENVLWVTEVWESQAHHDSSLSLRQVQDAIPRARPLVANFERIAVTEPMWMAAVHP